MKLKALKSSPITEKKKIIEELYKKLKEEMEIAKQNLPPEVEPLPVLDDKEKFATYWPRNILILFGKPYGKLFLNVKLIVVCFLNCSKFVY